MNSSGFTCEIKKDTLDLVNIVKVFSDGSYFEIPNSKRIYDTSKTVFEIECKNSYLPYLYILDGTLECSFDDVSIVSIFFNGSNIKKIIGVTKYKLL